MKKTDCAKALKALRAAIRVDAELAEKHYGVTLHPKRHADLIAEHRGAAKALRRLLEESPE